ncbi:MULTISPECIES: single-stranded DNA-binding protein [Rhodococcus]|uniref:single-stranded DNA-binding protein n=1 Tax=Rhodococcus TaxID=1827 RepID=UPI000C7B6E8E|nr:MULTISPECIES: single-stranded DNA-binding protein [Rhodococcus]AUM18262.1 single-stranded DNA-binding protein [Rhodococcus ruber]
MASAQITLIGSLGNDPELRFTPSGAAVATFNIAVTERIKNGDQWEDGDTTWYRCTAWRDYAEHISESLRKGMQVMVLGRHKIRTYEKDGVQRQSNEVQVDEVGPTLRFATASVQRANSGGGGRRQSRQNDDPWGSSSGGFGGDDEPPF